MREAWIGEALSALEDRDLRRSVTTFDGPIAPTTEEDGAPVLRLASNSYLGLATHPGVRDRAKEALEAFGPAAGASPLVTGRTPPVERLEEAIAELKGTQDAVVFPSGYHANTGAIPVLAGEGDLILSDALNHASIVDGCRASDAAVHVYRHSDVRHLAELFQAHRDGHDRCLIVTDGVFSMDGEIAKLPRLAELARQHEATLMVDDAHATGVLGPQGSGTLGHHGMDPSAVDVQMGTLSKALASQGGFVAGSRALCELLRNRARSYVFSTALAPPAAAAARAAIGIVEDEPERRKRLHDNADRLREGLASAGFKTLGEATPIVPVVIGDRRAALEVAQVLEEEGVVCPAIRPPSVPDGTSRLRATVMATHTPEQIDEAVDAFQAAGQRAGVLA